MVSIIFTIYVKSRKERVYVDKGKGQFVETWRKKELMIMKRLKPACESHRVLRAISLVSMITVQRITKI